MLAVKEKNRKQGIGSALLSQFLSEMKHQNITRVELEVRTTNQDALDFYKTQGFILQEILHHFYQNGENAYSMKKDL